MAVAELNQDGRPLRATLEIEPAARSDLIDVRERVVAEHGDQFSEFRRALYMSHHTTAGYMPQGLVESLGYDEDRVRGHLRFFNKVYPPDAGYMHDEMELRTELSDLQKHHEPRNADSHLKYICAGLQSCVSYEQDSGPVWLVELDGVHQEGHRKRRTTVIGYNGDQEVARTQIEVEVGDNSVYARNLRDSAVGFTDKVLELAREHDVAYGRVDVELAEPEVDASLTVNEYEVLLMTHDLRTALTKPVQFMTGFGRSVMEGLRHPLKVPRKVLSTAQLEAMQVLRALRDPRSIPGDVFSAAQLDAIQVLCGALDRIGISGSLVARMVARALSIPVQISLKRKRGVSIPVLDRTGDGLAEIPWGTYQSLILVQWAASLTGTRTLDVTLSRLN